MKRTTLSLLLFTLVSFTLFSQQTIKCHLSGTTHNRPESKALLLAPYDTDLRVTEAIIIPIVDNKFDYTLECQAEEMYELIFQEEMDNGSWMSIYFMSENGSVKFELYPQNEAYYKNIVQGTGKLNQEYEDFNNKLEELFQIKTLAEKMNNLPNEGMTPEAQEIHAEFFLLREQLMKDENNEELLKKMDNNREKRTDIHERDAVYTQEMKDMQKQMETNSIAAQKWRIAYVTESKTPFALSEAYMLLQRLKQMKKYMPDYSFYEEEEKLMNVFNSVYEKQYPDHPVTQKAQLLIEADKIKTGNKYIDFTCADFGGKEHTLSKEIEGKIALIDLWASWCGPCRRKSVSMIPVYDEFKDKGFTIVGVAREYEKENGLQAMEKDGYKWLNLLELKDAHKIWYKYGIGNGGGATFLVDRDGIILEIDPTAERVKEILLEKLN